MKCEIIYTIIKIDTRFVFISCFLPKKKGYLRHCKYLFIFYSQLTNGKVELLSILGIIE